MKFFNGTEFHCGTPKYSGLVNRLLTTGFVGAFLFPLATKAPSWISDAGVLMILAGLVVLLAGHIAARKEWVAKQKSCQK